MVTRVIAAHVGAILGTALALTTACGEVSMPRLTTAPPPQPTIPASVTLIFDDSVRTATLQETVCADTPWTGQLGDAIIDAFLETGRARFAQVTFGETAVTPQPASSPQTTAITAAFKLAQASMKARTRTGDDEDFLSQLDIQLGAVFQDASGRTFPEARLVYSDQVKIHAPQFRRGECATGGLDGAMKTAAKHLANQLTGYVAELTAKAQGQTTAGAQVPPVDLRSGEPSMLTVRATLLDENNNLVLEGGEKVGIRIDVTNTGTTPSGPATASLSGTPTLIDAFSGSLASPVQISSLRAGETTSTMLWGKLATNLEGTRGELTVTVTPSGTAGGAPATQTLVAAMVPRGGPSSSASSPAVRQAPAASSRGSDPDRYAVIVGLSLYRSPWPGWRDGLTFDPKQTVSLFAGSLDVPEGQTLLLQDELAAQADIEEALTLWLPKRVAKDSLVFFYFAGQTVADPANGEIFLIPYDATPASSPFRLISIRFLQSRLQKLGARLAIAIIDSPMTARPPSKNGKIKSVAPNWIADLDGSSGLKARTVMQVSRMQGTSRSQNSLLAGLTGPADLDHDGFVTVGEWLRWLRGTAVTAPPLPPTVAVQSISLAHVNHR